MAAGDEVDEVVGRGQIPEADGRGVVAEDQHRAGSGLEAHDLLAGGGRAQRLDGQHACQDQAVAELDQPVAVLEPQCLPGEVEAAAFDLKGRAVVDLQRGVGGEGAAAELVTSVGQARLPVAEVDPAVAMDQPGVVDPLRSGAVDEDEAGRGAGEAGQFEGAGVVGVVAHIAVAEVACGVEDVAALEVHAVANRHRARSAVALVDVGLQLAEHCGDPVAVGRVVFQVVGFAQVVAQVVEAEQLHLGEVEVAVEL